MAVAPKLFRMGWTLKRPGSVLMPLLACFLVSQASDATSSQTAECGSSEPIVANLASKQSHEVKGFTNPVGMEFVLIPAGTFRMGAGDRDRQIAFTRVRDRLGVTKWQRYDDEAPAHPVRITRPFFMGRYEVTQAQWTAVMHHNPSSDRRCGGSCPVETVSWNDAAKFIDELRHLDPAHDYRLPTEAEWEYAARAGGPPLVLHHEEAYGWYAGNSGDRRVDSEALWRHDPNAYGEMIGRNHVRIHPVGTKQPNGFGLFDMLGNVWEWMADWYDPAYYSRSPSQDPQGPPSGTEHVLRGGSFDHNSLVNAPVTRVKFAPTGSVGSFGFRVAIGLAGCR